MKKIGGYPCNRYPTDMGMSTRQIFFQRVGYEYEVDIFPAGRVWENYYPYPIRPVDIPKNVYLTIIIIIIIIIIKISIIIIIVLNNNNSNIIILVI